MSVSFRRVDAWIASGSTIKRAYHHNSTWLFGLDVIIEQHVAVSVTQGTPWNIPTNS